MRVLEVAAANLRLFGVLVILVLTFGLGIGLGLSASGVLASHDDPDTIHACVNPFSSVARIVEDPANCAYYEEVVEWQGLAGAADVEDRLAALETLLACVQSEAGVNPAIDDIVFEGCNVHVRDGSGDTDDVTNGLGNLIVGYNEDVGVDEDRGGSHNLVVGQGHSYSSFGGFITGFNNRVSGAFASVSGGASNTASGARSSVSGGLANTAGGSGSSVSGGQANRALFDWSSVSGGFANTAFADFSSVSGGSNNTTVAIAASISGGQNNTASGDWSSISGGLNHVISFDGLTNHDHDWIAGSLVEDF